MTEVELTIVGIRKYLPNGEEGFPELFARLPVGSIVYLRKEPEGIKFSGSVTVWDDNGTKIGNISKTDRRYIELEIPDDEMLPATVSGHSAKDKCMYAKAINTKGIKPPYIRDVSLVDSETVFSVTECDQNIQRLTSLMKTKLKMLEDGRAKDARSLMTTANEYATFSCFRLGKT